MKDFIRGIGIENFRVFKNNTWIDFAPITILTGTNSSGKSSVIRAVNLLKEYFTYRFDMIGKRMEPDFLDIEETLRILGDFSKMPNNESTNNKVVFELPITMKGIVDRLKIRLNFNLQNDLLKKGKLTEVCIYSENKDINIFIISELENFNYSIKINYWYFLEEYKRESKQISEYFEYLNILASKYKDVFDTDIDFFFDENFTNEDLELFTKDEALKLESKHPLFHSFIFKNETEKYLPFFKMRQLKDEIKFIFTENSNLFNYGEEIYLNKNAKELERDFLENFQLQIKYYTNKNELEKDGYIETDATCDSQFNEMWNYYIQDKSIGIMSALNIGYFLNIDRITESRGNGFKNIDTVEPFNFRTQYLYRSTCLINVNNNPIVEHINNSNEPIEIIENESALSEDEVLLYPYYYEKEKVTSMSTHFFYNYVFKNWFYCNSYG